MASQNQSNLLISEAYTLARQGVNWTEIYNAPACDSLRPIYFLDSWLQNVTKSTWHFWATSVESTVSHAPVSVLSEALQTRGAWFCRGLHWIPTKYQVSPTAFFKPSHRSSRTFWKENFRPRAELWHGKFACHSFLTELPKSQPMFLLQMPS